MSEPPNPFDLLLDQGDRPIVNDPWYDLPSWAKPLFRQVQRNARLREIDFTLTVEEYAEIVQRANGRCAISGLVFDFHASQYGSRRPFAPSIDRVNSGLGYTAGNVRLVCNLANIAMNEWGVEPLLKFAKAFIWQSENPAKEKTYSTVPDYINQRGLPKKVTAVLYSRTSTYCATYGIASRRVEHRIRQKVDGSWLVKRCQAFPLSVLSRIEKTLEAVRIAMP